MCALMIIAAPSPFRKRRPVVAVAPDPVISFDPPTVALATHPEQGVAAMDDGGVPGCGAVAAPAPTGVFQVSIATPRDTGGLLVEPLRSGTGFNIGPLCTAGPPPSATKLKGGGVTPFFWNRPRKC